MKRLINMCAEDNRKYSKENFYLGGIFMNI